MEPVAMIDPTLMRLAETPPCFWTYEDRLEIVQRLRVTMFGRRACLGGARTAFPEVRLLADESGRPVPAVSLYLCSRSWHG